jgi:hypothetical protein
MNGVVVNGREYPPEMKIGRVVNSHNKEVMHRLHDADLYRIRCVPWRLTDRLPEAIQYVWKACQRPAACDRCFPWQREP